MKAGGGGSTVERMQAARNQAPTRPDQVDPELQRETDEWARSEIGQAWIAEVRRRVADREAGRTKAIPYDEAMAMIQARLAQIRACR